MRIATLALVLLVGCGPGIDPLIGSYAFTLTGTDTATDKSTTAPSGAGTMSVTANALTNGYFINVAHSKATACVISGTANEKSTDPEITIDPAQTCVLSEGNTTTTVSFTSGKLVLDVGTTRAKDSAKLDVAYAYSGQTVQIFTINFAGTGVRTYAGLRK